MPSNMTDHRFQFLLEQFKLHSRRLGDLQSERSKITTWSTLAIFGYFGWVLTNATEYPIFVLSLPVLFASLGFAYVFGLQKIIDRHSAFLDHLENELFRTGPNTEWKKFKTKDHRGRPLRLLFFTYWLALWVGTIALSGLLSQATPVTTESISPPSDSPN